MVDLDGTREGYYIVPPVVGLSSKDSPPPSPSSSLDSSSASFPMAAKEDPDKQSTYIEHRLKSESDSTDSLRPPTLTPEEEARAWRKIDIRLMPILALLYLFSFLDRGSSHRFSIFWLVSHQAL